jgi:hypothetical protein
MRFYDVRFAFAASPEGEDTWDRIAPAYVVLLDRGDRRVVTGHGF